MIFISKCERTKSLFLFQLFVWTQWFINGKKQGQIHYTSHVTQQVHQGGTLSLVFLPISLVLIKLVEIFHWSWMVFLSSLPQKQVRKILAWVLGWEVFSASQGHRLSSMLGPMQPSPQESENTWRLSGEGLHIIKCAWLIECNCRIYLINGIL